MRQGGAGSGEEQGRPAQPLGDGLEVRRGYWKAIIAIAAKNARMAWAVLVKGENFEPLEVVAHSASLIQEHAGEQLTHRLETTFAPWSPSLISATPVQ
jgi:hypothetical protein